MSDRWSPARLDEELVPGPLPSLELTSWATRFGLRAGITARGESPAFDLGLAGPGPAAEVLDRWHLLRHSIGARGLAASRQVHLTRIATHLALPGDGLLLLDGVDGHCTTIPGLGLAVTVADCVPVYLAHPPSGAVALLHAGWRGVAAGILAEGAGTLAGLVSDTVDKLVMHCGVSICPDCYEVGSEVFAACGQPSPAVGRGGIDLRAVLASQARAIGIGEVSVSTLCSAHDPRFFSHRGSGGEPGRMVAYLLRPS